MNQNTVLGENALVNNINGIYNTAIGYRPLNMNTSGSTNTANGVYSLHSNTTGYTNTANGVNALYLNTTGYFNTASGAGALYSNTTGFFNTANGVNALGPTPPATKIQPAVLMRSVATRPAATISHWDRALASVSLRATTILISAMKGLAASQERSVSGQKESTSRLTSQELGRHRLFMAQPLAIGITADGQLGVRASSVGSKN